MGKRSKSFIEAEEADEKNSKFISSKLSRKILKVAREQQHEIEAQEELEERENDRFAIREQIRDEKITADDDNDSDSDIEPKSKFDQVNIQQAFYHELKIDPSDEQAFEKFYIKNVTAPVKLGDLLQQTISERRTELETLHSQISEGAMINKLDPAVRANFEDLRKILKNYRSGKVPKCFKFVPTLTNWEQILHITDPTNWSAAAMYQATRIFTSNLNTKMAARFFKFVLLPRIRDDIEEFKRLNFHLYQALRKALYKPGSFMQGILLPLLESGTCTLREAIIVGSIIAKNTVPRIHSSVALLKVAEMEYTGANSIILRIFIHKKYALPFRVIDAIVHHFLRFERDLRTLPVLWHQAFLTFAQVYKNNISSEQRDALLNLCRYQKHYSITPEIQRELHHAKCLDAQPMNIVD